MTGDAPVIGNSILHPAALWAIDAGFNPEQVDCTTTVVLKILDNKCKMLPAERAAVLAVYDAVKHLPATLFDSAAHEVIGAARQEITPSARVAIHDYRLYGEEVIPKPVMKRYKAFLREGLFG